MSVLIRFSAHPDSFVLGPGESPLRVELERIVSFDRPKPSFAWVPAEDAERFEDAADAEGAIERVNLVEGGDRSFYRVEWSDRRPELLDVVDETGGVILSCVRRDDRWQFRVRFPDSESVQRFQERHGAASFDVDVTKVLSVADESEEPPTGVTAKQYLALRAAYQLGYFERPREVTLTELAEHFDVSAQSMSGLLRRGLKSILEEELPLEALEDNVPVSTEESLFASTNGQS